ncbi:MAG: chemotaxis protein CheA [Hyphomicrobiales bacterium]|nr:chemotaxis protein CheA [Hyphomicrobiales bacterium]
MNLDEIKATFFVECSDLMSELESGLFSITPDDPDIEIVNSVFRAVHSIKGGAGSFGLDELVHFSHVFENALDFIRTDIAQVTQERLDLLLRASDLLADIIAVSRDGGDSIDASAMTAELELGFDLQSGDDSEPEEEIEYAAVPISIMDMELGQPDDGNQYKISFVADMELYLCGHDPRQIFRELSQLGEYSAVCDTDEVPSLEEFNLDETHLSWQIEIKTDKSEDEIREVFEWVDSYCELSIEAGNGEVDLSDADLDDVFADFEEGDDFPVDPFDESLNDDCLSAEDDASTVVELPVKKEKSGAVEALAEDNNKPEPKVAAAAGKKTGNSVKKSKTIRVESLKVDSMINLMGELVISQSMLTEEINASGVGLSTSLGLALTQLQNLTREIQGSVMAIRAQPVQPVFMRMSRVIREICNSTGKKANLVFEGEHTEVDSTVIEGLVDPITHLIRNAIDHGVESPEKRLEMGKPEVGTIQLSASHNSGRILIEIKDDGAGINRARVLEKALENGVISSDANLSDNEIDDLIFAAGFSTNEVVTDVSGRGVGMDVVRQSVQAMGGRVSITSTPNSGSVFTLSLPLTLAILDGMVINDSNKVFVIPVSSVIETMSVRSSDISQIGTGGKVVKLRNNLVPIVDVANEMGFAPPRTSYEEGTILIVESGVNSIGAFIVDSIIGQQQVVIKSLERNFQRVPSIAAATILGNGNIALVLDVDNLVNKKAKEVAQQSNLKLTA